MYAMVYTEVYVVRGMKSTWIQSFKRIRASSLKQTRQYSQQSELESFPPGYPLPGLVLRCTHITNHATTSPPARVLRVPDASLVGVWVSWEPCVNWTL